MSLTTIKVYGPLAKKLKARTFKAAVNSAAEAARFLLANWPHLEQHMVSQNYRIRVGGYSLDEDELDHPCGQGEIQIIPVIGGAGATARIIGGVALFAAAMIVSGGTLGFAVAPWVVNLGFGIGASLALGGVSQLLSPVPSLETGDDTQGDPRKSYSFSGVQNISRQGVPIPIVYGRMIVGSIAVDGAIDVDQQISP